MVLEFFRRSDDVGLSRIAGQITRMLVDSRHMFDEAMGAVLAGADPAIISDDLYDTDHRINEQEQEIRRELVVHASVRGTADIAAVLVMLMVSRKIERIGDNAKNIYDLAADGVNLSDAEDLDELTAYRDTLSSLITEASEIFTRGDAERGRPFVGRTVELQREFDDHVTALVGSERLGVHGVPRALLYRYLKRIVANLEGIVSAVVNPVDRIDYTTEDDEGAEGRDPNDG